MKLVVSRTPKRTGCPERANDFEHISQMTAFPSGSTTCPTLAARNGRASFEVRKRTRQKKTTKRPSFFSVNARSALQKKTTKRPAKDHEKTKVEEYVEDKEDLTHTGSRRLIIRSRANTSRRTATATSLRDDSIRNPHAEVWLGGACDIPLSFPK